VQLSTAKSLPKKIQNSPIIANIIDGVIFHLGFSCFSKKQFFLFINLNIYIRKAINILNSIKPSVLEIPFPIKNRIAKMIMADKCSGSCFFTVSCFTLIGLIKAAVPTTNIVLTIVLPITLANTILPLSFINPWIEIASSGALVPNATIVSEMIIFATFRLSAVDDIPSTKRSAPFTRIINPTIIKIMFKVIRIVLSIYTFIYLLLMITK